MRATYRLFLAVALCVSAVPPAGAFAAPKQPTGLPKDDVSSREAFSEATQDFRDGQLKRAQTKFSNLDRSGVPNSRRRAAKAMAALALSLQDDPRASSLYLNQPSGRAAFVSLCTAEGIFAGVALTTLLIPDSWNGDAAVRTFIGSTFVGGISGALGAYFGTKGTVMPAGKTASVSFGAVYAPLMTLAAFGVFDSAPTARAVPSVLAGASLLGGLAGMFLADAFEPTPGQVAMTTNVTSLGTLAGLLLHFVVDGDASSLPTTLMASSLLSLVGGAWVSRHLDWSAARAGVVFAGGLAGASFGGLLLGTTTNQSEVGGLVGLVAGAALTVGLTRAYSPSRHAPALTLAPSAAIDSDGRATPTLQLSGGF